DRPVRRAGRPVRRRDRAHAGRFRDARRRRVPARAGVLRVRARDEADRRPHLRGRLREDASLDLEHGRVRRLRHRSEDRDGRGPRGHARRAGEHPLRRVRPRVPARQRGRPAHPQDRQAQRRAVPDRPGGRRAAPHDAVHRPPGRGRGGTAGGRGVSYVRFFDTTLRDGEQSPGVALNTAQKLEIAHALARLGVDVIEAGFPITSQGDFECVRAIASEVEGPIVCALARTHTADIDRAAQAVEVAKRPMIHIFTSASDVHLEHMLRKTREEVLELSDQMVRYARNYAEEVEFSAQDCMRADPEFVYALVRAAIAAGATTINVPDTTGYGTPQEYGDLIRSIFANVPEARDVRISTHCHDDLGMAVANSLAAVEAGATQVEATINGIGERAGNTSLEEVAMALYTRADHYGVKIGINTREIYRVSKLVERHTGMLVPANKAVVGENAFAHESGIHQDGVIKNRETYEIMNAELVGRDAGVLVMGKHSGRRAFRKTLEELGYAN